MSAKGAEQVLLFDAVFIALLALYGIGVSQPSFTALSSLQSPKLAPLPSSGSDLNPFNGIVQATAYIGWAIVNGPVIVLFLIQEAFLFFNIFLSVIFSPTFSSNGVPIVGFIFTALQVPVFFEIFRIFRGSSSGM